MTISTISNSHLHTKFNFRIFTSTSASTAPSATQSTSMPHVCWVALLCAVKSKSRLFFHSISPKCLTNSLLNWIFHARLTHYVDYVGMSADAMSGIRLSGLFSQHFAFSGLTLRSPCENWTESKTCRCSEKFNRISCLWGFLVSAGTYVWVRAHFIYWLWFPFCVCRFVVALFRIHRLHIEDAKPNNQTQQTFMHFDFNIHQFCLFFQAL